ncbi:MAG TPA: hypothetical protein VH350_11940 [Candidatus Sulfotelmatobacter sp.]|jgi:hypothetical protein|nr:hypothetical protein [Candidatus Sulfotelmatobacter sp.]
MSPSRQGVLLWEIPDQQGLPQAVQERCCELLTLLLLAAVSIDPANDSINNNN